MPVSDSPKRHPSRRETLGGMAALGSAAAAMSASKTQAAPAPEQNEAPFRGKVGETFDESTPDYLPHRKKDPSQPNIVAIMVDDVGYSDFGCYGSEIRTPAIDRLATNGLQYTNFRTTGVCSATRACFLTGLNNHSAGIGWLTYEDSGYPGYRGRLAPDAPTIAEALSAGGYRSYLSGKWHVNSAESSTSAGPFDNWPAQRGFHRSYWFQGHSTDFFRPMNFFDGNESVTVGEDFYATHDISRKALGYVKDHMAVHPDTPFFVYIAHPAAHSPLQAPADSIARQKGRYDRGWDVIREERFNRQKELGLIPAGTRLPDPNPGILPWTELAPERQRLYARYMEIYAAMVEEIDSTIAELQVTLDELGILDNTIIVLFSDNGGSPDGGLLGSANLLSGRIGGMSLEQCLDMFGDIGGPDSYPMYPAGWAAASNTPYRLYKHDSHLGGVADPLIVHWPKQTAGEEKLRPNYLHTIDLYPTLLEAAGVPPLETVRGMKAKPLHGRSALATLKDADSPETRTEQHFEMEGSRALYSDGWRLVSKTRDPRAADGWELFDVTEDINETNDLSQRHPEIAARLVERWEELARKYDVFPIDSRPGRRKSMAAFLSGDTRSEWVFHPPVSVLLPEAAPELIGRSNEIEFSIAPFEQQHEGVLFAYGNMFCGRVLYIRDGKLFHELALKPHSVIDSVAIPEGTRNITIIQHLTKRPWKGRYDILFDGQRAYRQHHDRLLFSRAMQGLQIGANHGVPVSSSCQHAFSGTIKQARFRLDTTPYTEKEIEYLLKPPFTADR